MLLIQFNPVHMANDACHMSGSLAINILPRVMALSCDKNSRQEVQVDLKFYKDEQGFNLVDGKIKTMISIICQRCFKPYDHLIESTFLVAMINNDNMADQLPKKYEPYVYDGDKITLSDLIEDEILLNITVGMMHSEEECSGYNIIEVEEQPHIGEVKENPFNMLRQLKLKE